jgi:hypothetical protein
MQRSSGFGFPSDVQMRLELPLKATHRSSGGGLLRNLQHRASSLCRRFTSPSHFGKVSFIPPFLDFSFHLHFSIYSRLFTQKAKSDQKRQKSCHFFQGRTVEIWRLFVTQDPGVPAQSEWSGLSHSTLLQEHCRFQTRSSTFQFPEPEHLGRPPTQASIAQIQDFQPNQRRIIPIIDGLLSVNTNSQVDSPRSTRRHDVNAFW